MGGWFGMRVGRGCRDRVGDWVLDSILFAWSWLGFFGLRKWKRGNSVERSFWGFLVKVVFSD